jgi:hypothetical protein
MYVRFLTILNLYKTETLDAVGVMERIEPLFEGHRDLIIGFSVNSCHMDLKLKVWKMSKFNLLMRVMTLKGSLKVGIVVWGEGSAREASVLHPPQRQVSIRRG